MLILGIDIGSTSAKACLIDDKKRIIKCKYIKNEGIIQSSKKLLNEFTNYNIDAIGVTGSGREILSQLLDTKINKTEIIAHAKGALHFKPDCKTVIDIGGEDSKLIILNNNCITDFRMNTACGGGTGATIESIALKFNILIEKYGDIAIKSKNPVKLPSKCGIFCQSAVVSNKNMGINTSDILMGVCKGIVENYVNILVKEKKIEEPIIFQGACAKNKALKKSFEEHFNKEIHVPKYCEYMGAIGIAIIALEDKNKLIEENIKIDSKIDLKKIICKKFITNVKNCVNCNNNCQIIELKKNNQTIGIFGNRCDKFSI